MVKIGNEYYTRVFGIVKVTKEIKNVFKESIFHCEVVKDKRYPPGHKIACYSWELYTKEEWILLNLRGLV